MSKLTAIKQALAAVTEAKLTECDYAAKGFHLDLQVPAEQVVTAAEILDREGFFIEAVTGVDWLGELAALAQEAAKAAAARAAAAKKAAEAAAQAAAEKAAAEGGPEEGGAAQNEATPPAGQAVPAAQAAAAATPEPGAEQAEQPQEDSFEVVYDFNHYPELCRVTMRTRVPRSQPAVPTISAIYPGANWHERETHDFFGIVFSGHPDLSPLLLPEDADFHPLRKDYQP